MIFTRIWRVLILLYCYRGHFKIIQLIRFLECILKDFPHHPVKMHNSAVCVVKEACAHSRSDSRWRCTNSRNTVNSVNKAATILSIYDQDLNVLSSHSDFCIRYRRVHHSTKSLILKDILHFNLALVIDLKL